MDEMIQQQQIQEKNRGTGRQAEIHQRGAAARNPSFSH